MAGITVAFELSSTTRPGNRAHWGIRRDADAPDLPSASILKGGAIDVARRNQGQVKGRNLPASAADAILESIAKDLETQGIRPLREQNSLRFQNDARIQWSFFRYVLVGSGMFEVAQRGRDTVVDFRLSAARLFVLAVCVLVLMSLVAMASQITWLMKVIVVTASFVWLVGMNYLLLWARTILFLRRIMRAAKKARPAERSVSAESRRVENVE